MERIRNVRMKLDEAKEKKEGWEGRSWWGSSSKYRLEIHFRF